MPEALISAISVIFALIGIITLIYNILVRVILFGKRQKILIVFPVDDGDDLATAFACSNMLKAHPLLSHDMYDISVGICCDKFADSLETEPTEQV